jgi:hypothetical protein
MNRMKTDYSRLSPSHARATLVILALATLFCLEVSLSPLWQGNVDRPKRGHGDAALYRAIVDRIHNGQGYYQATVAEQSAEGYPTRSVFNWRTPLPMYVIAKLPQIEWAKYFLGLLSLALMFLAFESLSRDKTNSFGATLACVLLLSGPLLFNVMDNLFIMPILWTAVFIALSLCAYGISKPRLGMFTGLLALFMSELALPYCLLCAAIAWIRPDSEKDRLDANENPHCTQRHLDIGHRNSRRPRVEILTWGLGLSAWLVFFAWHCWNVSALIAPDAIAHRHGWIRFGGAGFVLATAQMNAYLLLLPPWATALYFAAAVFGLTGWQSPLGTRIGLTACLYLITFAVIGQDFNQYWGSITAPLLCFGIVRFPASMRDLCRAAFSSGKRQRLPAA